MSTAERLRSASSDEQFIKIPERTTIGVLPARVAGKPVETGDTAVVRSPYDDSAVAVVHRAGPDEIERAIAAATEAFDTTRKLASHERAAVLERISGLIAERRDDLARTIALEAGKPLKTARVEAERAAFTFKVAAEESKRIYGEIVPLDWIPGTEGRVAHIRRVPLGPIAGITPFNFPLNLVVHKVAPALAAGNPIVVRPASQTPVSALRLGEIVVEAGWPEGGISVVPSSTDAAAPLVEDDRIKLLTFTGSPAVGWALRQRAGRKRVTLELGGNAPVIVHSDADAALAAERIAWGGFVQSGQTCISVQRVYVHSSLYDDFAADLVRRVEALVAGDPTDEQTDIGPLIDDGAAERVESWVEEAVAGGAKLLTGGKRDGRMWQPTVLADAQETMRVSCEEAFAPLVVLYRYDDVADAIARASSSRFGLQAGLFTRDLGVVEQAFEGLDTGGLMVNDVSTFRVDHMPYGGVKDSGSGREGLRYAIEEMTELKLLTFNTAALQQERG
jgi:acyl-CoA reductase-like NAD-dependent aldehyde dehydrogenase